MVKNIPNALTIIRMIIAILVIFLLLQPGFEMRIIALFLFVLGSLTDFLDGFISRKLKIITKFGKIMDPIADKLLTLGSLITLSLLKIFSFWWLIPIIIREIAVTLHRICFIKSKKELAAKKSGKIKTALQITAIIVIFINLFLKYHLGLNQIINTIFLVLMYALLILINILTIYSGIIYFKE